MRTVYLWSRNLPTVVWSFCRAAVSQYPKENEPFLQIFEFSQSTWFRNEIKGKYKVTDQRIRDRLESAAAAVADLKRETRNFCRSLLNKRKLLSRRHAEIRVQANKCTNFYIIDLNTTNLHKL